MIQVDKVTQRNAAQAEELANTADQTASHAENLQLLMSVFRASHSATRSNARATPAPTASGTHDAQPQSSRASPGQFRGERQSAIAADLNGVKSFNSSRWTNEL
jgi:hypothetical protein